MSSSDNTSALSAPVSLSSSGPIAAPGQNKGKRRQNIVKESSAGSSTVRFGESPKTNLSTIAAHLKRTIALPLDLSAEKVDWVSFRFAPPSSYVLNDRKSVCEKVENLQKDLNRSFLQERIMLGTFEEYKSATAASALIAQATEKETGNFHFFFMKKKGGHPLCLSFPVGCPADTNPLSFVSTPKVSTGKRSLSAFAESSPSALKISRSLDFGETGDSSFSVEILPTNRLAPNVILPW